MNTLPTKYEMFQLGELADALLKAQGALREIAGSRNLFGDQKDREAAQAALADIENNPRLSNERLKALAEEFQAQRAEKQMAQWNVAIALTPDEWKALYEVLGGADDKLTRTLRPRIFMNGMANSKLGGTRTLMLRDEDRAILMDAGMALNDRKVLATIWEAFDLNQKERLAASAETSTVPVKLSVGDWKVVRHTLAPGDSTGLKSRIFFSGMAHEKLGGLRTVNLSREDCAAILDAMKGDIDHLHPNSWVRHMKQDLLRTIQDQISADMAIPNENPGKTDRKPDDGKFAESIQESVKKDIQESAKDGPGVAPTGWGDMLPSIKYPFQKPKISVPLKLSVDDWRFVRDVLIASGDRLNLTSHISGDRTVVFDAEECKEILDVLKRDIDANPFVRPMDKIFRNASKTELLERIQAQIPAQALEHTNGAKRESVRDRIQTEMAQSHLDGTMRESVKKDIQESAKEDLLELVRKCDAEASEEKGNVAHSLLLHLAVMNPGGMSLADVMNTMTEDKESANVEEILAYESRVTGTIDNLVASGFFSLNGGFLTSNVDLVPGQGVVFKNGQPPSHVEAGKAKPSTFPDPQKQSYFGCSWNPPGEEGDGGFAP